MTREADYKLCYIDGNFAWFTTAPLDKQWGDDWDDAPYEHNAGEPYEWNERRNTPQYELCRVAWCGDFEVPGQWECNSRWSVEKINSGAVAWLTHEGASGIIVIHAGTPLSSFSSLIERGGGTVYYAKEKEATDGEES